MIFQKNHKLSKLTPPHPKKGAYPVGKMLMNLPAMPETQVRSLGQEDPLEKGIAIPWTEEPGAANSQTQLSN